MARPLTYQAFVESTRWPGLDGLRAIAVLLVVTWHVPGGELQRLHGESGVTIFFVLSGFLITSLGLRSRFRYGPFLVRRAFRILPLLYLGILAYAVAVFALRLDDRGEAYAHAIPWILGGFGEVPVLTAPATSAGGEGPVPFAAVWSLGIEEKFYLVWPVLMFVLLRGSRYRAAVAAGLCLLLWAFTLLGPELPVRLVRHYAPLLVGATVALVMHSPAGHRVLTRMVAPHVALLAAVTGVVLMVSDGGEIAFQITVAVVLAHAVLHPGSLGARLLSTRAAVFVASISYGLYLFHSFGLKAGALIIPSVGSGLARELGILGAGLALALPACWLLHIGVEKPLTSLGRRVARSGPARLNQRAPAGV